jgi:hypothetical protein
MLKGLARGGLVRGAMHVPGLRRLPMLKLLAIGEIAFLTRTHVTKLDAAERRRFLDLLRKGRGRHSQNLTNEERDELVRLVAKAEPRLFAGTVADVLSPVPLPRRVIRGRKR